MKNKIIGIILVTILSLVSFVLAHTGNDELDHCSGMCDMMSGTYGYSGMLFGGAFSILVLVALVLLIVWLIKQIQRKK